MSSVQSYIKQQNILYAAALGATDVSLNYYNVEQDSFSQINVSLNGYANQLAIFRDMGEVKTKNGHTYRKVQLLSPSSASTFGVVGASTSSSPTNAYNTYWYENSIMNGIAYTNALFRIQ